ncbi:hypothetical protein ACFYUJ_26120 [Streptomyces sp. NPDC004520]|uniref:hypothetical protein n=1 Tax=Streptomyces sp. NPDC004520 TaxID=3364702 RepID=UPI0036A969D2
MTSHHAHLPRARRLARLLAALPLAAVLLGAAGCSSAKPATLDAACAVVLDGSGSGSAKKGFDAKAKLDATIVPFMKDQHCGTLAYAPITASSKASPCHVNDVDLDPPTQSTDDVEAIRQQSRVQAVREAYKMLTCAQKTNGGSDILGGIARAAEALPSGSGRRALLVVSDFEQFDPEFSLTAKSIATPDARTKSIDKLMESRGVPPLSGMDVYPVGYGMNRQAKPSEFEPFDAFWTEILTGRGKARVHDDYRR